MSTIRQSTLEADDQPAQSERPGEASKPLSQSLLDAAARCAGVGMMLDRINGRLLRASSLKSSEPSAT